MTDTMAAYEWAEVFQAGVEASRWSAGNQIADALSGMEEKCREISNRGRVQEDQFMGKPIPELTYEEAVICREFLLDRGRHRLVPVSTLQTVNKIIAEGGPGRCPAYWDEIDNRCILPDDHSEFHRFEKKQPGL